MEYQKIIDTCYCGDGATKLDKAEKLATVYGESMLLQENILDQIEILKNEVVSLDAHMTAMDMGKSCSHCAARPNGGCCSVYMGNENNDTLLLLMNILTGVEVSLVCDNGVECCFLGERGCILLFKPIFCLNYLCSRIREECGGQELMALEQKSGALLGAQSHLEQLLIRFLQLQSD